MTDDAQIGQTHRRQSFIQRVNQARSFAPPTDPVTRTFEETGSPIPEGGLPAETQPVETQPPLASVPHDPYLKEPQEEFDEYGAELGPEARVWKTYVREADKFDTEKVDEWNKSLDVILIFAALFSAISTAFVMESAKRLQEDPANTSARMLAIISDNIISAINGSSPPTPPNQTSFNSHGFIPSRSDVCVNVLWFLSLSLSVAVSLIAMLAKEWCHQFISGRTGHHCAQARRRQQRWDGLVEWRMPELLVILPSLIHLALFLFAVGLCLYLWDLHFGVALPVIAVTMCALGLYGASTALPLLYEHCPYSTTISRLARTFYTALTNQKHLEDDHTVQDLTTTQALGWLIEGCEDPKSVDVALQAIAGADGRLPLEPLQRCNARMMICKRLTTGSAYPQNYEFVFGLYARALALLQPTTNNRSSGVEQYDHANELKRKIRELQMITERVVARLLPLNDFLPTEENLLALRVGSTAAPMCLHALSDINANPSRTTQTLESALDLLDYSELTSGALHAAAFIR